MRRREEEAAAAPAPAEDIVLLREIRDALRQRP
jgi:large-conductance mechanosensitive channel